VLDRFLGGLGTSKGRIFLIYLTVITLRNWLSFKTHTCAHIDYQFWIYYKRLDNELILKSFLSVKYKGESAKSEKEVVKELCL
jgi:hypothetical protein